MATKQRIDADQILRTVLETQFRPLRSVSDEKLAFIYSAAQAKEMQSIATLFRSLGDDDCKQPETLASIRNQLISILRAEGCKGPHYGPTASEDSLTMTFADAAFTALQDVRALIADNGNNLAATIRLAAFFAVFDRYPLSVQAIGQHEHLTKQVEPKRRGAAIQTKKAEARRKRHIEMAKQIHEKNPTLSRGDVSWEIHRQLAGSKYHPAQRTIFEHIRPIFPK